MKRIVMLFAVLSLLASSVDAQKAEIFEKKDKFGLKENEKIILKADYVDLKPLYGDYYVAKKKLGYGVISKKGGIVIPDIYDNIKYYGENIFEVKKDGKWGLVDRLNKEILPIQYSGFKFISDDICEVKDGDKVGFLNKFGDVIIPAEYQKIEQFADNTYLVQQNGKYGLLTDQGESLVPVLYDSFAKNSDPNYYDIKLNNKLGLMNSSFKVLLDPAYDTIEPSPIGMILMQGDKIGFYTINGKVVDPVYSRIVFVQPEFGLAVVRNGDKLGFVTSKGVVTPAVYENISRFSNRGVAFVEKAGKLIAVNVDGKEMVVQDIMKMGYANPPM